MDACAKILGMETLGVEIHRLADGVAVQLGDIDSIVGGLGDVENEIVEAIFPDLELQRHFLPALGWNAENLFHSAPRPILNRRLGVGGLYD